MRCICVRLLSSTVNVAFLEFYWVEYSWVPVHLLRADGSELRDLYLADML